MVHRAGYLANFPYVETKGKFLVRKDKQHRNLWKCRAETKNELMYKVSSQ